MIIARVTGNIVATQKNKDFDGAKILIVRPLTPEGEDMGEEMLAVDSVDAGPGDTVLVVLEGWSASYVVGRSQAPIDAAVIGVIDEIRFFKPTSESSESALSGVRTRSIRP